MTETLVPIADAESRWVRHRDGNLDTVGLILKVQPDIPDPLIGGRRTEYDMWCPTALFRENPVRHYFTRTNTTVALATPNDLRRVMRRRVSWRALLPSSIIREWIRATTVMTIIIMNFVVLNYVVDGPRPPAVYLDELVARMVGSITLVTAVLLVFNLLAPSFKHRPALRRGLLELEEEQEQKETVSSTEDDRA